MRQWIYRRIHHRGLHGSRHIDRERRRALILVITGLLRAACWLSLGVLYLVGVPFTHALFASVAFVALISLYANAATDFGQACASLADLSATDAHHDSERARAKLGHDFEQIDEDIARLAALQPGQEAQTLAAQIRRRLGIH